MYRYGTGVVQVDRVPSRTYVSRCIICVSRRAVALLVCGMTDCLDEWREFLAASYQVREDTRNLSESKLEVEKDEFASECMSEPAGGQTDRRAGGQATPTVSVMATWALPLLQLPSLLAMMICVQGRLFQVVRCSFLSHADCDLFAQGMLHSELEECSAHGFASAVGLVCLHRFFCRFICSSSRPTSTRVCLVGPNFPRALLGLLVARAFRPFFDSLQSGFRGSSEPPAPLLSPSVVRQLLEPYVL